MEITSRSSQRFSFSLLCVLLGFFVLSGCASLNENECQLADWHAIGYEDGADGQPADYIGRHRKACSKHNITPDLVAYRKGRDEGLGEYCIPQQAYELGSKGRKYPSICPAVLHADLRPAYDHGKKVHDVRSDVRDIRKKLSKNKKELKDIKETLVSHQAEIILDDTTQVRRIQLLADTRELGKRETVLEEKNDYLANELKVQRAQLDSLQSNSW